MHYSYDPRRTAFELTSYLDDSGSDDLSPVTAIGGPVMSKDAFIDFSASWSKMLRSYRVEPPLHMAEFLGNGTYAGMYPEMKVALFTEATDLIMTHRLYSMSVAVPQVEFRELLSAEVRKKLIGPYAMAFFCVVMTTHDISSRSVYAGENVAYLLDTGFPFSKQLTQAHSALIDRYGRKGEPCFVGPMTFDSDSRVPVLQAADTIA